MYRKAHLWIDVVSRLVSLSLALIGLLEAIDRVAKYEERSQIGDASAFNSGEEDEL